MIKVEIDIQGGGSGRLRSAIKKAGERAIKRTMTTIETAARRKVAEESGLKPTLLRKYIRITKTATQSSPQSILRMLKKGIPLVQFGAKPVKIKTQRGRRIGVSVDIGDGRNVVPGAFLATMKSGHKGVYKREGKKRTPIVEQFSSAMTKLLNSSAFTQEIQKLAVETFKKNFASELRYQLTKRGGT